ncbi:MAG: hypothetical protein ACREBG_11450 [Pyrinomonadaceae bacterium]
MKRCIQCDFVYEDDQVLCDMDGSDLAYEPTLHPFERNAAPETGGGSTRSKWKSIAALPVVVFILGAVLFVGNYSAHRPTPQAAHQPTKVVVDQATDQPATPNPVVETPVVEPPVAEPPVVETTPAKQQPPQIPANNVKASKGAAPILKPSPARIRPATPPRVERKPLPAKANHKKESKIGGFLKKTSRLIKKPFKNL